MADPRQHYDPTESERQHRKAMALASAALLDRLKAHHPRIIDQLTNRSN
jgi:hypothetical protein